ncbi:MAG: DUF3617 domain-containing protein [Burkholderiales bacterium]|jgi:hypothetical protein|nr:DUF3617 domain-containing protein [Burkholderiales bacterium]
MKSRLVLLFCGSLFLWTANAQADELPARKAGLWEIAVKLDAGKPGMMSRQCTDAAAEKKMGVLANDYMTCSKRDIKKTSNGYIVDSVCSLGGEVTSTSHSEVTGSFNSAYTMKVTDLTQGGIMGKGETSVTTIEAKWLGACPAGWKPGDTETPGGTKINLLDDVK